MTHETTRTFRNELWRSLPAGVLDTLTATFGMLVAVRVFAMGDMAKASFLAATSGGMVTSLFVVPLLLRAKSTIARTAAKVQMLGGASMAVSAAFPDSPTLYLLGLGLGIFCFSMQIPLMTQIYRMNYPEAARGKLYAIAGVTRAGAAVAFGYAAGWLLDLDLKNYTWLLWSYALSGFVSGLWTYGLPATEFAAMISDAGLKVSGMHVGLDAVEGGLAATLEEAEALNAYHVIVPWVGAETYADGWDALGQRLERAGKQVAAAGKSLAYHNHAFEFVREPHERTGFDQLFAAADSAFLKAEIDVWWAHCGGEDPAELIRNHGKRARLIHLKDGASCADDVHRPAGQGVLDWDSILVACHEVGAEFGVVELDDESREEGAHLNRAARAIYLECMTTGQWPGYAPIVHPISIFRRLQGVSA